MALSGDVHQDVQPEVFYIDPAKGLEKLAELLGMENPPRSIEGIDISNLGGCETVGSLVCFIDGKPFKNGYRRFRIRWNESSSDSGDDSTVSRPSGPDDYASIREVVSRRYRYAAEGEELYPDVNQDKGGAALTSWRTTLARALSLALRYRRRWPAQEPGLVARVVARLEARLD